jgi:hypothetical protein
MDKRGYVSIQCEGSDTSDAARGKWQVEGARCAITGAATGQKTVVGKYTFVGTARKRGAASLGAARAVQYMGVRTMGEMHEVIT